jgi:hypothetical protein
LNAGVPHLHLAGLSSNLEIRPGPKDELELDGAAVSGGALKPVTLRLIPFHSARDYRVWIPGKDRLKPEPVAITAFGKEIVTTAAPGDHGSISDERLETERRAVSRNGQLASFAVEIAEPRPIRRIVFRYGEAGRFEGAPSIEIKREPKSEWQPVGPLTGAEFVLPQPTAVAGIRVSGKPAGPFVSCAELSAFE